VRQARFPFGHFSALSPGLGCGRFAQVGRGLARPGPARLGLARPGSAWPGSARTKPDKTGAGRVPAVIVDQDAPDAISHFSFTAEIRLDADDPGIRKRRVQARVAQRRRTPRDVSQ
jgi:hypothetical protein